MKHHARVLRKQTRKSRLGHPESSSTMERVSESNHLTRDQSKNLFSGNIYSQST